MRSNNNIRKIFVASMTVIGLFGLITSCTKTNNGPFDPTAYMVEGDTLIHCEAKLEGEQDITYLLSNATKYIPEGLDVEVYFIEDVHGETITLNSFEVNNYECASYVSGQTTE